MASRNKILTVKQVRGQIAALTRENNMLKHKMDLMEQNASLKQRTILSKFLAWMEETGAKQDDDKHRQGISPIVTDFLSVEQGFISAESSGRSPKAQNSSNIYSGSATEKMTKSPDMIRLSSKANQNSHDSPKSFGTPSRRETSSGTDAGLGQSLDDTNRFSGSPSQKNRQSNLRNSSRAEAIRSASTPNRQKDRPSEPSNYSAGLRDAQGHRERSINMSDKQQGLTQGQGYLLGYPESFVRSSDPVAQNDSDNVLPSDSPIDESSEVREHWQRRLDDSHGQVQSRFRSTPMTSTPKKLGSRQRYAERERYDDLKNNVGSLLEETRRMVINPDVFAPDVSRDKSEIASSTPSKTPQKRVIFADEVGNAHQNPGDMISSVPLAYNCDPLNLFTPNGRTSASVSRQLGLSYAEMGKSPVNIDGFVDSRDERSFRHLTLNDSPNQAAGRGMGESKRSPTTRKKVSQDTSKNKANQRSGIDRENCSAKRDLSLGAEEIAPPRPSVDSDRFFSSRKSDPLNNRENAEACECHLNEFDDQALNVRSRNKRSRYDSYEEVTKSSRELSPTTNSNSSPAPIPLESSGTIDDSNLQSDTSKNHSTIESLENELEDIYRQNLDDEMKITDIRRKAVKRFDNWRGVIASEMTKLEKDGRDRLVQNLDKLSQSLPSCLRCDCSTGRLSEIDDTTELRLADLEDSRTSETFHDASRETPINAEAMSETYDREKKWSTDAEPTSPNSSFMNPHTTIFGEIAFQLERVVLSRVFRGGSKQINGYNLSNMEKMIQTHYDYGEQPTLRRQLEEVKGELHICGWNHDFHTKLVGHFIKKFGTFPTNVKAKSMARKRGWNEPQALKEEVLWRIPKKYIHDMIIILDCLFYLSKKYDIPLFTW